MKRLTGIAVGLFALPVVLESCIQQFTPPEVGYNDQYLVVDGFFNVGASDTSRIELRRTQNVNQQDQPIIESGASIVVEGEFGGTFAFNESSKGLYLLPPASYDLGGKYRIRIKTNDGKEYLSDYVEVTRTPAIDSVTNKFDANRNSMVFYVNTHDELNKTQFYRWKFEETWEYEATYYSALVVENDTLKIRQENINKCWANKKSGSILLGSTVKLSADVIKDLPLNVVPVPTNKLFIRYSLLVRQYGLSRAAFEYWTDLSKSTQLTGSLFDPQPGKVTGNIHSTSDPKELVFGYFSASTEATKRLTIAPKLGVFPRCTETDTIPVKCNGKPDDPCAFNTQQLLLTYFGPRSEFVVTGTPDCTDCRLAGGTNKRPSFW